MRKSPFSLWRHFRIGVKRLGALALALLFFFGCRERGRPDPNIRMAISHDREDPSGGSELARTVPLRVVVPPEVGRAYSGIKLHWKDSASGEEGVLSVPLGGSARLAGSRLEVRADAFLPAFTMQEDLITSTGTEPQNPAARIAVLEEGREVFSGWIFARFPDVHPFSHPRFSLRLDGGVPRSST